MVSGSRIEREVSESVAPVTAVGAESAAADIGGESRIAPPGIIMPPRPPQPRPQSGLLTAGEHDDLLNPELYADYVRKSNVGQAAQDVPVLDTSRLLTVELRDERGRAVPFAQIEVRCTDGNSVSLETVSDGRAVFFPELDRLSDQVWIRADGSDWRSVRLSRDAGSQTVKITTGSTAPAVRKLDLALVVDATGSMADEMRYLQAELASIVGALEERHKNLDIRVGFTFYRDEGDEYVTRTFAFDDNIERAQARMSQQRANGGGDYPEAMHKALIRAAGQDWRDDAVKTLLLVADAPPHNRDVGTTWLAAEHLR
ncbi:MAG: vWA domain-containing protein, partial [Pseudomonadota bacterium]